MTARPRIAFVAGGVAGSELARLLPALAPDADLVVCTASGGLDSGGLQEISPRLAALAGFASRIQTDAELAAGLAAAAQRDGRAIVALESADPLARAASLARARLVDAVAGAGSSDLDALAVATAAGAAGLRIALVRGSRVVVLAHAGLSGTIGGAGVSRAALVRALDADAALTTLELACHALANDLGVPRPRLLVCALEPDEPDQGSPGLARACARARSAGLDVTGPLPAEEALQASGADGVLVLTRDQARLALVLGGSGAVARLVLGLPFVRTSEDPAAAIRGGEVREASLHASVTLAARIARARGDLVGDRERRSAESKRTIVAVTAREAPAALSRCPYCRRAFDDEEPGLPCARCETPHHRACIHEHGRCTINGCGSDSVRAHGREVRIDRLGGEGVVRHPFQVVLGPEPTGEGLRWLRVDAPFDDPDEPTPRRDISLVLRSATVARGSTLEGTLVVRAPRLLRASGAVLRVRSTLEVRPREADARPTLTPMLDREALVFGRLPEGVLGRLSSGLAALLGSGDHVSIPQGVRRYPFSLRFGSDHPASVRLDGAGGLEAVTTSVGVELALTAGGVLAAEVDVTIG